MIITLSPMRCDLSLPLHRRGDVLTIGAAAYDFGPLPEGGCLPRAAVDCDWLLSDVTRLDGVIRLTLALPHGPIPLPAPPEADVVLRPVPLVLTEDGPVALPFWTPEERAE
jgi:hypothetical protein